MNDCRLLVEEIAVWPGVGEDVGCLGVLAKEVAGYWVGGFGKFEWDVVHAWVRAGRVDGSALENGQ
jgi:hypothetical protein